MDSRTPPQTHHHRHTNTDTPTHTHTHTHTLTHMHTCIHVGLAAAKTAAMRINLNIDECGVVAPRVHSSSRAPLLLANLLTHNPPSARLNTLSDKFSAQCPKLWAERDEPCDCKLPSDPSRPKTYTRLGKGQCKTADGQSLPALAKGTRTHSSVRVSDTESACWRVSLSPHAA